MKISTPEDRELLSKVTEKDLVEIIKYLDLPSIPPDKRAAALTATIGNLIVQFTDPTDRNKDAYKQAVSTYFNATGRIAS